METATNLFSDSKVNITTEGKSHLGAAISSNKFRKKYVNEKFNEWCEELKVLSKFAKLQPQAAYTAFCFGEQNKYSSFLRTIPNMSELMKPVDEIIQIDLLPLIIGKSITENERQLYSLPARSGGLDISVFSEKVKNDFGNSVYITAPLVALIVTQEETLPNNAIVSKQIATIKRNNSNQLSEKVNRIECEQL